MSAPQHILYGVATTVAIDVHDRPSAATVSCYAGDGAAIFEDKTASISTISTTLNGAVSAGGLTLIVNSATGIAAGLEMWVRSPDEKVLVKSVASTTATLRRPLLNAHATAAVVEGTRLTYSVSSTYASTRFWDGRLVWTLDSTREIVQACCCSSYPFDTDLATEQDLYDWDPLIDQKLPNIDTQRLLVNGGRDVLKRLEALTAGRAFTFIGSPQFTDAVALAALRRFWQPRPGEEAARLYDRYNAALNDEMERLVAGVVCRDANQDGVVEDQEQRAYRSIRLVRG